MAIMNGIWDYDRNVVFGSKWFNRWQGPMLYLLNHRSFRIREWTRDKLMIHEDPKLLIARITPNSMHLTDDWRNNQRQGIFYSYGRNRNRIIIAGDAIWSKIHSFDIRFANRFAPALNLGFDTLTQYSTVADGYARYTGAATWATAHDATTGTSSATNNTAYFCAEGGWGGTSFNITRSFYYFDTTISGSPTVSSAVLSLRGWTYSSSSVCVMKGTQADSLTTADFDAFSGNYYASKTSWSTSGYNDFTLDSAGISDLNLSGTTKYCARNYSQDYLNSSPGTSTYQSGCYFGDNTGNTSDPKLEITYTAGGGTTWTPKIIFID